MHSWVCTSWEVDVVVPRSIWPEIVFYFVFSFFFFCMPTRRSLKEEEEKKDLQCPCFSHGSLSGDPERTFHGRSALQFGWLEELEPARCDVSGHPLPHLSHSPKKYVSLIPIDKVFPAETTIGIKCPLFLKEKKGKENEKLLISVKRAQRLLLVGFCSERCRTETPHTFTHKLNKSNRFKKKKR